MDDYLLWLMDRHVIVHDNLTIEWTGTHFVIRAPNVPGSLYVDELPQFLDSATYPVTRLPQLPFWAEVARTVDDGGSKRHWTLDEIAVLCAQEEP